MTKVWEWSRAEGAILLVALALADHADDDGYCYPGIERLAKKCRISSRSVQRHIKDLCSIGELQVDLGKGVVTQGGSTNRYKIIVVPPGSGDNLPGGDKTSSEVVTNGAESGDKAVSPKPSVEPSIKPVEGFVEFWSAYPNKTGKPDALKAFKRVHTERAAIMEGLNKFIGCDQWNRGFIPNPSTFLNQRRWEDSIHETQAKNGNRGTPASRNDGTLNAGRAFKSGSRNLRGQD